MDNIPLALFKLLVAAFEHSYAQVVTDLQSPRTITLLQRLLLLSCWPGHFASDEQISDIALPIWSYVQEEISDNGIIATESGFGDPRWAVVKDVFEALVQGLRAKVEYPADTDFAIWPTGGRLQYAPYIDPDFFIDVKQTFSRYRADVGDCLISAFYVLRGPMLGLLVSAVSSQFLDLPQHATAAEASLYCIVAVQEAVPEDEDTHLNQLFSGPLLTLFTRTTFPEDIRLQRTALRLLGAEQLRR